MSVHSGAQQPQSVKGKQSVLGAQQPQVHGNGETVTSSVVIHILPSMLVASCHHPSIHSSPCTYSVSPLLELFLLIT